MRRLKHSEQISYERSSQAQSLTCPPILLSAAGYVDYRRMAFHVIWKRTFELTDAADDAHLQWPVSKFELVSLSQSAIGDFNFKKLVYGRIG